MITPPEARAHETVGRKFMGWDGGVYRCTHYVKTQGFWLLCLQPGFVPLISNNQAGDLVCVSERAIGGTYHRIHNDEAPELHAEHCECYICREVGIA